MLYGKKLNEKKMGGGEKRKLNVEEQNSMSTWDRLEMNRTTKREAFKKVVLFRLLLDYLVEIANYVFSLFSLFVLLNMEGGRERENFRGRWG